MPVQQPWFETWLAVIPMIPEFRISDGLRIPKLESMSDSEGTEAAGSAGSTGFDLTLAS